MTSADKDRAFGRQLAAKAKAGQFDGSQLDAVGRAYAAAQYQNGRRISETFRNIQDGYRLAMLARTL